MNNTITEEKLNKYFSVTKEALDMIKNKGADGIDQDRKDEANDALDMAQRYYDDAQHFRDNGEWTTAFAALNYAHGWLDAGARLGLFKVKDSRLFTVDDE